MILDSEIMDHALALLAELLADLVAANRILLAEIRSRLLAAELNRSDEKPPIRAPDRPG